VGTRSRASLRLRAPGVRVDGPARPTAGLAGEVQLIALTHNLLKLFRASVAKRAPALA
jgi:hypothetical protein